MKTLLNLPQKKVYKLFINNKVRKPAFESHLELKERSKKQLKNPNYKDFGMQPHLNSNKFSTSKKCYPAKMNFKKLNKKDIKCVFKCDEEETQCHIFQNCHSWDLQISLV